MGKRIVLSDTKAIRIEGIQLGGNNYVSLRQLYCTKKDKEWKPAKQGITIPVENAVKIAKYIKEIAEGEDFKEIKMERE